MCVHDADNVAAFQLPFSLPCTFPACSEHVVCALTAREECKMAPIVDPAGAMEPHLRGAFRPMTLRPR